MTLAESRAICGVPGGGIDAAIAAARASAQNIRELVFCLRMLSRVNALAEWWARPPLSAPQLAALIDRFMSDPAAAEFAAVHTIGESLPERREAGGPAGGGGADTLCGLPAAVQGPVGGFVAGNSGLAGPAAAPAPPA